MIREEKRKQYGEYGLKPSGIIVHNTNNYSMNAKQLFEYLNGDCTTSQGCHWIIDSENEIEVMPMDWKVWSTGKGNDYAFNHLIAIEICSNNDLGTYLEGEKRAIDIIKKLMNQFSISKDEIYYHHDFNERTYCPANIMSLYKNKNEFLKKYFKEV